MTTHPTPQPVRRRSAVAVVIAVIGAVALVSSLGNGILAGMAAAGGRSDVLTAPADDVRSIDLDIDRAATHVRFGDVREATLSVDQPGLGLGSWRLTNTGGTLEVRSPDSWGPFNRWTRTDLTLVLPRELAGQVALDGSFNAGEARIDGDFSTVAVELNAGRLHIAGAAEAFRVEVNAGDVTAELTDVATLRAAVQAGALDATLTGEPPRQVEADLTAGRIELAVPDADYAINHSGVLASTGDVRVRQDPTSPLTMDLRVQLGELSVSYS